MLRGHAAKLARLEVHKRLMDFGVGVHHKRPMAHDRFVDRLAAEDQQHGVVIGFKADARAITLSATW